MSKKNKKMKNNKLAKFISIIVMVVIINLFIFELINLGLNLIKSDETPKKEPSGSESSQISDELSIHFLELGNGYAGDSIYIKAGDVDILVDGGSRANSADTIDNYLKNYVTDGILEYVIVTHYDQDHIAALVGSSNNKGILERYEVDTLIDAPKSTSQSKVYQNYCTKRELLIENGTKHYTGLDCYNNESGASRYYELTDEIELEFLYNYYYDHPTSDQNDNSVCFLINQNERHFLFTGDLEKPGEEKLIEYNTLPEVELFKAGHHGSKTSSNDCLLEIIKPKIVCVCCVAGSNEYTKENDNMFPTQSFISRISKYTDQVYVTTLSVDGTTKEFKQMNGNIVVTSNDAGVSVNCSNNNTFLKDTEWFKENRKWE